MIYYIDRYKKDLKIYVKSPCFLSFRENTAAMWVALYAGTEPDSTPSSRCSARSSSEPRIQQRFKEWSAGYFQAGFDFYKGPWSKPNQIIAHLWHKSQETIWGVRLAFTCQRVVCRKNLGCMFVTCSDKIQLLLAGWNCTGQAAGWRLDLLTWCSELVQNLAHKRPLRCQKNMLSKMYTQIVWYQFSQTLSLCRLVWNWDHILLGIIYSSVFGLFLGWALPLALDEVLFLGCLRGVSEGSPPFFGFLTFLNDAKEPHVRYCTCTFCTTKGLTEHERRNCWGSHRAWCTWQTVFATPPRNSCDVAWDNIFCFHESCWSLLLPWFTRRSPWMSIILWWVFSRSDTTPSICFSSLSSNARRGFGHIRIIFDQETRWPGWCPLHASCPYPQNTCKYNILFHNIRSVWARPPWLSACCPACVNIPTQSWAASKFETCSA